MFKLTFKLALFALAFMVTIFLIDVAMGVMDGIDHYALTHSACATEVRYAGDGAAHSVLVCPLDVTPTVSPQ